VTHIPVTNFRWRSLTADQAAAIRRAMSEGVRAQDLAAEYGVTVRTIYRARDRAYEPVHAVTIGDWVGRFALTSDGPVQVEPWRPTAEAIA
jgi:hypothetical protein